MNWKSLYSFTIVAAISSIVTFLAITLLGSELDQSFNTVDASLDPAGPQPSPSPLPTPPPTDPVSAPLVPENTPSPLDLMPCAIVQDVVSVRDCQYYTMVWNNLATGEAALDNEDEMTREQEYPVSFAIKGGSSAPDLQELLGETPEETFSIKVGGTMVAKLSGTGFEIDPTGPITKALGPGGAQKWDWRVKPIRSAKHKLVLEAFISVSPPDGKGRKTPIRTFKKDIVVHVTNEQRISDAMSDTEAWLAEGTNLLKGLAAFLAAAGGVYVIFIRPKRKKSKRAA